MKTKLKYIYLSAATCFALSLGSCSDFMDLTPEDQYDEAVVWSDAELVRTVVNDIYGYVQHGSEEVNSSAMTDDAFFTHVYGTRDCNEATVSGSNLGWYDRGDCPFQWTNRYKGIYRANLFLKNIDNVPPKTGVNLDVLKGEVYFLRAYLYTELVRGFGGVPLVDRTYSIEEASNMNLPRSNMADCLDFILKDIEQAINLLPETVSGSDLGRATKGAAKALKARILLHVASPLFADRTVNTLECNQYNGDRQTLYQEALATAKEVIGSGTYSLVDCNGSTNDEIADKFHKTIISNNSEMIWAKQFINIDKNENNTDINNIRNRAALLHGPNGYHNWAGTTPTHDLVMDFEMEDGSLPQTLLKAGDKTTDNPYANREPRFYASIGYDGAEWGRARASDAAIYDPTDFGSLQMGYYELSEGGSEIEANLALDREGIATSVEKFNGFNGVDTRKSNIENWNGSYTGYLEKKLIDGSVNATEHNFQTCPYPYIRLAEMYLIAAEACIELNKLDEAVTYLDALRLRIGRPDTKATLAIRKQAFNQVDMRKFLQHERRIELMYEESRYYDVRRWMIAPETGNKPLLGITVVGRLKPGKKASLPYVYNTDIYEYTYHVIDISYIEKRRWDNKMYFAPIKREEIKRNPGMVQNPGME